MLNIKGFNNHKYYKTYIIEIEVKINNKMCKFVAAVVPSINPKINMPSTQILTAFQQNKLPLADKHLGNKNNREISIKLGVQGAHVLPLNSCAFGLNDNISLLYYTSCGIVLAGDLNKLGKNLPYLKYVKNFTIQADLLSKNVKIENKNINLNIENNINKDFEEENSLKSLLNYDNFENHKKFSELDIELIKYLIQNTNINETGRLIMPLLWNKKLVQFLPNNFHLAHSVLKSTYKKFSKQPLKLEAYDNVINEQLENGIIQPVENINVLKNKNDISFIAHNAVFREDVETTKCRIVYLSNICEKDKLNNLSHNSVCLPGPNLNNKLDIALILLRFNKYLLIFDLEKAYHQIELLTEDSEKLHFLWFNNIKENDFRVKAYKLLRIPFGIRCSPTILMLALYIILILHVDTYIAFEDELRKGLFNLAYMDNLAYSSNSENDILQAYHRSHAIFNNYKFNLQKFYSNSPEFKKLKDGDLHIENENDSIGDHTTKLLGMIWDTKNDTIYNNNNNLDPKANTLRTILSSVNGLFDPLNIGLPGKNRAKLFLHSLQSNKNISWDTKLDSKILKEYKNICSQYNKSKKPELKRFIGDYKNKIFQI